MKQHIKYTLYGVLFLTAFMFFIDYAINILYMNNYRGQTGGKINYLIQKYDRVQILAIGDSRCAHHINPSILGTNNYNLSHNGQSLIFHTGLLDQIINNETLIVDTILLNLDLEELNFSPMSYDMDIKRLKYYYYKNNWINNKITALDSKEKYKFCLPIYKWNGVLGSLIANKFLKNKIFKNGYSPKLPSKRDSINVYWQITKQSSKNINTSNHSINKKCISYLRHIQKLCRHKNIQLICYISPTFKPNRILNSQKAELYSFFSKNKIPLLDYSNAYYSFTELKSVWNWTDAFHLNAKGAEIFTKKIRRDLNNFSDNSSFIFN